MGWKRVLGYRQPSLRVALFGRRGSRRAQSSNGAGCLGCLGVLAALVVLALVLKACSAVASSPVAVVSLVIAVLGAIATIIALRGRAAYSVEFAQWRDARDAHESTRARFLSLDQQFGWAAANRIALQTPWQGQSADMLMASFGRPIAVDEKVMKAKTRHVFKFLPFSNR